MKPKTRNRPIFVLTFVLICGCVSNPSTTAHPTSIRDTRENSTSISPTSTSPPVVDLPEELILLAISDLAEVLSTSEDEIEVVSVETVEWPDSSLGCLDSDMMYTQVVTPGYLIVVNVEGENYSYHTDHGQTILLCESESSIEEPAKYSDPTVKDGHPNQPRDDDVIIAPPTVQK